MLDILIIMNNYFHDVATAVLLAAAVILSVLARRARLGGIEEHEALAGAYPVLTRFALGALGWIVIGGIPRVLYFGSHDLGAVFDDLGVAIVVKHVVEVLAVVAGAALWFRAGRLLRQPAEAAETRGKAAGLPL